MSMYNLGIIPKTQAFIAWTRDPSRFKILTPNLTKKRQFDCEGRPLLIYTCCRYCAIVGLYDPF